jgi:16S rRNA (guanine966-N2)-methyltransferase
MTLRIIGGTFKGRSLKSPKGPLTKPTTSLLRKAVFDICQQSIEGAHFLDLFACSGAMGIEALSRGAQFATFIESNKMAVRTLQENIALFSLQDQTQVICADVFKAINYLMPTAPYEIVYIDPPYLLAKDPKMILLLEFLDKSALLSSNARVFIEEGSNAPIPLNSLSFSRLHHKDTRKFGSSTLHQLTLQCIDN